MALRRPDFAAHSEEEWQSQSFTLKQTFAPLCLSEMYADVVFVPLMNAAKPPKKFPAHKLLLRARSSVFSAQFFYDLESGGKKSGGLFGGKRVEETADKNTDEQSPPAHADDVDNGIQEIEIPDVEPEAFEQFLRFLYTDEGTITEENAFSLLYTANKYGVAFVAEQCTNFVNKTTAEKNDFMYLIDVYKVATQFGYTGIREHCVFLMCSAVEPENAFYWLEFAQKIGEKTLETTAFDMVSYNADTAIESSAFLSISQQTLVLFAKQKRLIIDEKSLFNALIAWAEKRNEENAEKKTLRELLGSALFCVHFWHMTRKQFSEAVLKYEELLTNEEISFVLKCIANKGTFDRDTCPFPYIIEEQREKLKTSGKIVLHIKQFTSSFAATPGLEVTSEPVIVAGIPWQVKARSTQIFYNPPHPPGQQQPFVQSAQLYGYLDVCLNCHDEESYDQFSPIWPIFTTCCVKAKRAGCQDEIVLCPTSFESPDDDEDFWKFPSEVFYFAHLAAPENGFLSAQGGANEVQEEDDVDTLTLEVDFQVYVQGTPESEGESLDNPQNGEEVEVEMDSSTAK